MTHSLEGKNIPPTNGWGFIQKTAVCCKQTAVFVHSVLYFRSALERLQQRHAVGVLERGAHGSP